MINIIHYSVQFSWSVTSNSLWLHGLQHTRPLCPSPTSRVHIISQLQIKTMRYRFTPIKWPRKPPQHCKAIIFQLKKNKRMAQTQHTNSNQRLVSMWSDRNSHSLLVGVQMTQTLEDNLAVSHETKYLFRWLRTKESACQCWRHKRCGFKPWVRKILKGEMATHSSILAWNIPWTWSLIGCSL